MKKLVVFLFVFFMISLLCINSYAKYVIEDTSLVANINIDGEIPKIEFISVSNTNEKYNNYANKTHTITINFRVKEKNLKEDNIEGNIKYLLDGVKLRASRIDIKGSISGQYVNYTIKLFVMGNGELKIVIPEGSVIDNAGQVNEEAVFDTGITIDNIAPVVTFTQKELEDGKINAKIKANEKIREVNAWNSTEDETSLNKEFACNVLYPFPVTDLAGNSTNIDVKIDKATNIEIKYSAGNYNISGGFQTSNEVNEIVGTRALAKNNKYKVEAIGLWWQGLDEDFIGVNCYNYTNWGEGKQGLCNYSETRYTHGYNPGENEFATLENSFLTRVNGYIGVYLGGLSVNCVGDRGTSAGEPVPPENEEQQLFGISALNIRLKDYSYYSIVYQVWVDGQGWLEPASDGEETTLAHDKPIGAYRMSLIPKTEKEYLVDLWQKDVGTNNMK